MLGVTFKRDVPDERYSPAVKIIELLQRRGVEVVYHDRYVPALAVNGHTLVSQPLSSHAVAAYDGVIIATDHTTVDYQWVVDHARLIVDLRNATAGVVRGRERIIKL